MTWIKQGRIFNLGPAPNRSTHAQVPTPYMMDDRIRIYYACRNNGKAFIAYFDLAKDLKTILKVHEQPVFEHGNPGMFDADGVMPSCILSMGDELWLYYIGWSELKNTARYQNEIGIAVSKDGGETFERMFEGPIMGRSSTEPGLAVMPFVMRDEGVFKMWYQSGAGWHYIDGRYEPIYVIKHAESDDGIEWRRLRKECLPLKGCLEALSRPYVIKDSGYFMYYCYRGCEDYRGGKGSYRMGGGSSTYGAYFTRDNDVLSLGDDGDFDSEMQCYPAIVDIDGRQVMLYNGNDFGQTGIGVAVWED